jgi:hypothetical protein
MVAGPVILSILAMTFIVGARYVAVSGGFAWWTRRRSPVVLEKRGRGQGFVDEGGRGRRE